jgi:hypothetical protein
VSIVEKESVFLNLETECYYGLDETGTRMWQLVTAGQSIENAHAELLSEFDVEERLFRQNLLELSSSWWRRACSEFIVRMWKRIRQLVR